MSRTAINGLRAEWARIGWFEPASERCDAEAVRLFAEHVALARAFNPGLYRDVVKADVGRGGWPRFFDLCGRVRDPKAGFDWKFGVLKPLSRDHSKARGWRFEDQQTEPGLFLRFNEQVVWAVSSHNELAAGVPATLTELARWYVSFAQQDLIEGLEWQLAERTDSLGSNPFVPLISLYALGFCPFVLSRDEAVLFTPARR
jgi:hypothetical protein